MSGSTAKSESGFSVWLTAIRRDRKAAAGTVIISFFILVAKVLRGAEHVLEAVAAGAGFGLQCAQGAADGIAAPGSRADQLLRGLPVRQCFGVGVGCHLAPAQFV